MPRYTLEANGKNQRDTFVYGGCRSGRDERAECVRLEGERAAERHQEGALVAHAA